MPRKQAIIIGSSSGIGKALSSRLKDENYDIISASHKTKDSLKYVDLTNRKSIYQFVSNLIDNRKGIKIDLLILNSGVASSSAIVNTIEHELDKSFQINTVNQIILIKHISPLLEKQSKIIFINSKSALLTLPFLGVYAATKKANLAIADALRYELSSFSISVICTFIGNTKTKMWTDKFESISEIINNNKYYNRQITQAFKLGKRKYDTGMSTTYVADKLVKIVNHSTPRRNYYIGKDAWVFLLLKIFIPNSIISFMIKKQYGF